MPNIAKMFKDEIQRLARREMSIIVTPLKKAHSQLKKSIASLNQKITALEKENKKLISRQAKISSKAQSAAPEQAEDDFRITGLQIRKLRGRLGISQVQLAKLLGVSDNIVPIWEKKTGRLHFRKVEVKKAIIELRSMKKREVAERLGVKKAATTAKAAKAAPKKRGRKKAAAASKPAKKPGPKKVSMTEKIITLVQKSPKGISAASIIKKTNASKSLVWNRLLKAKKEGKIISVGRGVYGPA